MTIIKNSSTSLDSLRTLLASGILLVVGLTQPVFASQAYRPAQELTDMTSADSISPNQVPKPYRSIQNNVATATSVEVLADLHIWRQATADLSPEDLYRRTGTRYEQASAAYQRLRSSGSFAIEVNRLTNGLGEAESTRNQ